MAIPKVERNNINWNLRLAAGKKCNRNTVKYPLAHNQNTEKVTLHSQKQSAHWAVDVTD